MSETTQTKVVPSLLVKKIINASPERVFDAWTKPELMEQWLFPATWKAKTTNDLRVGGTYSHDMIASGDAESSCTPSSIVESSGGEKHYLHTGEYLEIKRPEKLVFTWNSPSVNNTRVTIELRAIGNSTEVTLRHELLDTEEQRISHNKGWEGCLANLVSFFS